VLLLGFLFSAVGGYMAGVVGSSNNPISGVTLAAIITTSAILLAFLGTKNPLGPPAAIMVGGIVCASAAIAGDTMQDLKAGFILGSTPFKVQIMQMVGVVAAGLMMAPVVNLIIEAYGIGVPTLAHPEPLIAPQANLMAQVSYAIFFGGLPFEFVGAGVGLALFIMIADFVLVKKFGREYGIPVLAVAIGIYLPFSLGVPILLGGLMSYLADKVLKYYFMLPELEREEKEQTSLLFCAGVIAGESLMGIIVAIPIVISGNTNVLAILNSSTRSQWPGLFGIFVVMLMVFLIPFYDQQNSPIKIFYNYIINKIKGTPPAFRSIS